MPHLLDLTVMLVAYLLTMGALASGLRTLRDDPGGRPRSGGRRAGWPGLVRQVLVTAAGGYVLLLLVVAGYYVGVARHDGDFLLSAVTGAASLVGVALPPLLAVSAALTRTRTRTRGR
ncbi:DUF6256 family protein [Streptomyces avicenniae]|uniref:DUF6256 family protein n=1 Tax=Streptomyces avicenniae TaxID=500153 RepID=UPI00069A3DB7|nr:DUF6256 family protein [Streptomyces avicenniae]